jgi:hypothetical protein
MTLFPSRASCAQRELVFGFCSSPRNLWPSNSKSTSRSWIGLSSGPDSSRFRARRSWRLRPGPVATRNSESPLSSRSSSLVPRRITEHPVNPSHDSIRPLDCGRNQVLRSRARSAVAQILSRLKMPCHQYPGHNGQHAFATFIHSAGSAALSRAAVIFAFSSLYSLAPDSPLRQYLKRQARPSRMLGQRKRAERRRGRSRWSLNQLVMLKHN